VANRRRGYLNAEKGKMMTHEVSSQIPLLVVDDVYRDATDPQRLIGAVRVSGHPVRVILDFSRRDSGFIQYIELPWVLGMHPPSQHAVVELMAQVDAGQAIQYPVDLSERIRRSSPPSPFEPMSAEGRAALEAAAAEVHLDMFSINRSGATPTHLTLTLSLDGEMMTLEIELYAGHGRTPVMRWLKGPNPDSLSTAQRYAIQRALLSTYEAE